MVITMAIYKAKVESDYTTIPNATAQDDRLSFEARGLLTLLLSMPHDWAINNSWLIKQSKAGRDKVQRILNELAEYGYLIKAQERTDKGKFSSNDYLVYAKPVNGKPVNGKPVDGKTATTKETELQKKQDTNIYVEQARQCLEYLNQKLGTKYKPTTKSHIENLTARLKDGNTVDDIKLVIDSKVKDWGKDPKMSQYLRPSTMFIPKNFDGYLFKARLEQTGNKYMQQPQNNHKSGGFQL